MTIQVPFVLRSKAEFFLFCTHFIIPLLNLLKIINQVARQFTTRSQAEKVIVWFTPEIFSFKIFTEAVRFFFSLVHFYAPL